MKAQRAILFVGAGLETRPGIQRALDMGLHVVVSDANPDAPGVAMAHDFLRASTYDLADSVARALAFHTTVRPLSGVLSVGTDVPMTVAAVAEALALPCISPASARLAADKLAMKACFADQGVPIPWFTAVSDAAQLADLVARNGLPLVLKPVDSRGARGVLRLAASTNLGWAFDVARSHSPTGRVMLERYMDGPQVSTESLMVNGRAYTPGFSDRNYEYLDRFAPHIIENGGDLPSHLPAEQQAAITAVVEAGALAMGITNGVVKGDMVLHDGRPYVIELAARLSGGYFCTHEIPLNTGVDFVGAAIRQCLGEQLSPSDLAPSMNQGVAQRYIFPEPGVVRAISVPAWIAHDPNIAMCEIRTSVGAVVSQAEHHPARAGVVIATGPDRASAIAKAEAAVNAILIETTP